MPDLLGRLRGKLGANWQRGGIKGFLELHHARNTAQHEGVAPSADYIPLWSAEVERFTKSLVAAAFGVELEEVFAAAAVENNELRGILIQAETEAAKKNVSESIKLSKQAFMRALSLFRTQRRGPAVRLRPEPPNPLGTIPGVDQVREGLKLLQTYLDVATFASDLGDWLWLESVTPSFDLADDAVTDRDAQRALVFALTWILRYEAFTAQYLSFDEIYWPPATADPFTDYARPKIDAIDRAHGHDRPGTLTLAVLLSGVPPGWDSWGVDARQEVESEGVRCWMSGDTLRITTTHELSADDLIDLVNGVIDQTHQLFKEKLSSQRRKLEVRQAAALEYQRALEESDPDGRVKEIQAEGLWHEDIVLRVLVDTPSEIDRFKLQLQVNSLLEEREDTHGAVQIDSDGIYLNPDSLPAGALLSVLDAAISSVQATLDEQRREKAELDARTSALLTELRKVAGLDE